MKIYYNRYVNVFLLFTNYTIYMHKNKVIIVLIAITFFFGNFAFAADDPYYTKQWYIKNIKADESWKISKGSSKIVVAVIDTGVDLDHVELKDKIWENTREIANDKKDNDRNGFVDDINGWDFVNSDNDPSPNLKSGYSSEAIHHGTFISGLISAKQNNGQGIKGIAPNVEIMALQALDHTGAGSSAWVSQAIDYAVRNGADIINLSFGGKEYNTALRDSISNAYQKGVLIVAAAGNALSGTDGTDMTKDPLYPICYDQKFDENKILGVAASNKNNRVAKFSNYGKGCIDISAPGYDIISLAYQESTRNSFKSMTIDHYMGSSFASGIVSAAAALVKSVDPSLKPKEIINYLTEESGLLLLDSKYRDKAGAGRLDILSALQAVKSDTKSTSTAPSNPNTSTFEKETGRITNVFDGTRNLYVATRANGNGYVSVFDPELKKIKDIEVFGGSSFHGLNFRLIDLDNNGGKEIIAGAVRGDQPFVRAVNYFGEIISSFIAFDSNFRGGVNVSAGDTDGDGEVEIVVVPQSGYSPIVKIFNTSGKLEKQFMAYNENYKNGINVEVGDLDNDGMSEIVLAPHNNIMPKVKIFDGNGKEIKSFLPYVASFRGGVNIALGDINGDSRLDIITGAGPGGGPHVQAFNYDATRILQFMAYVPNFRGGVDVSAMDWTGDGNTEIITTPGSGGGPHLKIFNSNLANIINFFPFSNSFTHGIHAEVE